MLLVKEVNTQRLRFQSCHLAEEPRVRVTLVTSLRDNLPRTPRGDEDGQGDGHAAPQTGSVCSCFCPVFSGGHHAISSREGLGSDLSGANITGLGNWRAGIRQTVLVSCLARAQVSWRCWREALPSKANQADLRGYQAHQVATDAMPVFAGGGESAPHPGLPLQWGNVADSYSSTMKRYRATGRSSLNHTPSTGPSAGRAVRTL